MNQVERNSCSNCKLFKRDESDPSVGECRHPEASKDLSVRTIYATFLCASHEMVDPWEFDYAAVEKRLAPKICLNCKYYKSLPSKPLDEGGFEIRGKCMHPLETASPDGQDGVGVAACDCCKKHEEKST